MYQAGALSKRVHRVQRTRPHGQIAVPLVQTTGGAESDAGESPGCSVHFIVCVGRVWCECQSMPPKAFLVAAFSLSLGVWPLGR